MVTSPLQIKQEIKECLPSWCAPWHCLITVLKLKYEKKSLNK